MSLMTTDAPQRRSNGLLAGPGHARTTVADAMIHAPKLCTPTTTVAHVREILRDDHVHAVLIVDHRQTLLGLLCLKRTGLGFCSDTDIEARATERHANDPNDRHPPR
jgi:CBS domain-containing protein